MLGKLISFDSRTPPGMWPDAVPSEPFMWEDAVNVEFAGAHAKASGDREIALAVSTFPVRGLGALRTNAGVQELYFGTLDKLFRSVALAAPAEVGTGFTTAQHETTASPAGHWKFVTWGEWMVATNGSNRVQIRKGTGNFADLQQGGATPLAFDRARLIGRLGPHFLVANIPGGPNEIRWCSDDNIEEWTVGEATTAGDFTVRDADSEFVAMEPFADRLLLYTRDNVYMISYIGAPFIFGVLPVLNGIGAWGPSSVITVGRQHYGWGPSGVWQTDGAQFKLLDEGRVREYLKGRLYAQQASKMVGYHNEARHRVEWFYPTDALGENVEGVAYDYITSAWSRIGVAYTAVLERNVFQYAFGAAGSVGIYAENAGTPSGATLLTKAMDFTEVTVGKFISQVRVQHTGNITCEVGYAENVNDATTWLPAKAFTGAWSVYEVHRTVRYLRLRFSGDGPWKLNGFEVYGRTSGRRL